MNEVNMDIFDRIASEQKKARLPSHKNNPKDVVETAWKKHKEKHPEMAEFEGALDPQTGELSKSRIKENKKEMGKTASTKKIVKQINKLKNSFSSVISSIRQEVEALEEKSFFADLANEEEIFIHLNNLQNTVDNLSATQKKVNQELDQIYIYSTKATKAIGSKSKKANEIIDDIGLGRTASSHSSLIRFAERIFKGTPIHVELESDYDGTDILIHWDTSDVYDEDDFEEETKGKIESTDLLNLLNKSYSLIGRFHEGFVERGTSDISEGVFRIRIHDDA